MFNTIDGGFLVRRPDREDWFERLSSAGMTIFGQATVFAQFTQSGEGDGLDLMFVEDSTFQPMWQASELRDFGEAKARAPCLDHLLAPKLHALKQSLIHRTSKDADGFKCWSAATDWTCAFRVMNNCS
ncbi:MAG: hypothetical protein AB9869_18240 [Verrucomicrobiia bacterium]